jgi:hypothetical protein
MRAWRGPEGGVAGRGSNGVAARCGADGDGVGVVGVVAIVVVVAGGGPGKKVEAVHVWAVEGEGKVHISAMVSYVWLVFFSRLI